MALDIAAIHESFELIATREPELAGRFYDILFTRYPAVKSLFSADLSLQQEMLTEALVSVVDHLEDAPWLQENLAGLGQRHRQYGVTDDLYPAVAECLLETFTQIGGPDWTPEMERAWTEALHAITTMMMSKD